MKYVFTDAALPAWIAARTYYFGQENSRTYIMNECTHTHIQLDGLSSDFWHILTCASEKDFLAFINRFALNDDADSFLEELATQRLILLQGFNENIDSHANVEALTDDSTEAKFIEERDEWLRKNHFLFSLFLELTYRCNLKCVHCYNPKNTSNIEIPFDDAKKAVDDAYELGCITVILSGGEATTYSHFLELAQYIRSKQMSLEIFSNGQLLSDDDVLYHNLISLYPHRIGLSLYSMDMANHEAVTTVQGSYNKTLSVIKRLRSDGINVQIKNFLLNFTCSDCINVKTFGKSIGACVGADISLIPTIEGDKKTLDYALSEDDLFSLFVDPQSPLFIGEKPYLFNFDDHRNDPPCFGGFSGLCVAPNLDVHICVSLPISLGNLNSTSIKDLWLEAERESRESKLYQWRKVTCSDLAECFHDDYCRFCHYCAGMGYLENGYLKKSDVLCSQAKAKQKAYCYIKNLKEAAVFSD